MIAEYKNLKKQLCYKGENMNSYYEDKLSAKKLMKCYEIAPPRVKQYLEAEVNYVLQKIRPNNIVLELGLVTDGYFPNSLQKPGLLSVSTHLLPACFSEVKCSPTSPIVAC